MQGSQVIFRDGPWQYALQPDAVQWPAGVAQPQVCGLGWRGGQLYAANRSVQYPVAVFGPEGTFLRGFGANLGFGRSHGLFVEADGSLWLCDDAHHVVYHLDAGGGLIETMGIYGVCCDNGYDGTVPWPHDLYTTKRAGEPFNRPTGMIRHSNGSLYSADGYGNVAVHRFDAAGTWRQTWGGPGREPGHFRLPHALCEDAQGRIWVCDRENFRTQVFDAQGGFLHSFERQDQPSDCWCDGRYVYLIEGFGFLSIFDDLTCVARLGYTNSPLFGGHSLCGDDQGNLYVGHIMGPYTLQKLVRL